MGLNPPLHIAPGGHSQSYFLPLGASSSFDDRKNVQKRRTEQPASQQAVDVGVSSVYDRQTIHQQHRNQQSRRECPSSIKQTTTTPWPVVVAATMRCDACLLMLMAYGLWPRLVQRKREGHCVPIVNGFVLFLGCLIVQKKKGETLGALRRHPSVVW